MPFRKKRSSLPSNTSNTDGKNETFQITHPFHPLAGRNLKIATYRHNWGECLVYYYDDGGRLCSVPAGWTSLLPPDPFVVMSKGRSPFRVVDLLELSRLIQGIFTQENTLKDGAKRDEM